MRRLMVVAVLLCAGGAMRAQSRGAVDWIFVVDTSKSMRGIGGTKDIFGDVKESIGSFVREASDGDSATILTFDRDVRSHGLRDIRGQFDRDELLETVQGLEANGNRTHLGAAIAKGLERSEALARRSADPSRERAIVLFTDGKEDVRGIADPVSIPSNVQRAMDSRPWIFFVSMGEHEAQLDDFTRAAQRSRVLRAEDPDAIRAVAQEIRKVVQIRATPPPPVPAVLTIAPASTDLGELEIGTSSDEREWKISSDKPIRVSLTLAAGPGLAMTPHENVTVTPSKPAVVKIAFTADENALTGPGELTMRVAAAAGERTPMKPAGAVVQFTVTTPSPLVRAAKWLGAILGLLLLALLGLVLYSGKMPAELLASLTERNALEGELEIVKPRVASDVAFVGLPGLKANEIALSAIVPLDALAGSDARLFCRRASGQKKVWIAADKGTLRVNDVEVPLTELYDADTIRLGDATLRFNRIGHERPSPDSL